MSVQASVRDVMFTNDVAVVRSVINKFGWRARDPVTGGSLMHMAALNPNDAVMEEVLKSLSWDHLLDSDKMNHSAFELASSNPNDRVLTAMVASIHSGFRSLFHGERRVLDRRFFEFGALTKNLMAVAACGQKELIEQMAKGAISKSNMPVLKFLVEGGCLDEDLLAFCLISAAEFPQLWSTDEAVEWLVRRIDRLSLRAIPYIYEQITRWGAPSWYGWVVLVEVGLAWSTWQLEVALYLNFEKVELSGVFLLSLAGVDMQFPVGPEKDNPEARNVMRVLHAGFTPLTIEDPFVASVWRDYSRCALRLVRRRTTEICVALQSLQLPVLPLCEIMRCYYSAWPNVPFHHYWNIGKAVRQRYRDKLDAACAHAADPLL